MNIQLFTDEIEVCAFNEVPPRLQTEAAKCNDKDALEYWASPCGTWINKHMCIRMYKDEDGEFNFVYYIK